MEQTVSQNQDIGNRKRNAKDLCSGCRKDGKRNIRGRRAGEGCKTGSGGISCGLV